jgi:hypothetical protein
VLSALIFRCVGCFLTECALHCGRPSYNSQETEKDAFFEPKVLESAAKTLGSVNGWLLFQENGSNKQASRYETFISSWMAQRSRRREAILSPSTRL